LTLPIHVLQIRANFVQLSVIGSKAARYRLGGITMPPKWGLVAEFGRVKKSALRQTGRGGGEMTSNPQRGKKWLLKVAKLVATELRPHNAGTGLRIRVPTAVVATNTAGWSAVIGRLPKSEVRLVVWFDRITGHRDRKLYAAFHAPFRNGILNITKRVARKLWPVRTVGLDDTVEDGHLYFAKRLQRSHFNAPILEKYVEGHTFYGIYDPTPLRSQQPERNFCTRAIAFFTDVVHALPEARSDDEHGEVYPKNENRKRVVSHLRRERSGLLATECKIRDKYKCQVCGFQYEELYGNLGVDFAEAHHRVPLSQLNENVKTKLSDLATVCANCHRMLHKMAGKRNDITKLRALIRKGKGTK
jgi:5-methylcytosine-specific restriction endonuclease McrA